MTYYSAPGAHRPGLADIARAVRPGPIFLGLVIAAGVGAWLLATSDPGRSPASIGGAVLFILAGWVISLCLHEFAHAVTAFRFGDRSVQQSGYLTLNPLKYTHPGLSLGLPLLIILLGGIGFPGGAVYLDERGFTKAQRTVVSLAGPFTNVALGALLLLAIRIGYPDLGAAQGFSSQQQNLFIVATADWSINLWGSVAMLAFLQITAAVLNILPVPGFDGYGAIEPYLSQATRATAAKIAPYGFLLLFALLFIPVINSAFFSVVFWIFDLSGVPAVLPSYGWDLFLFWR